MNILWLFVAICIPYLTPLLVLSTPSSWPALSSFIEHYVYLVIFLIVWHGALMSTELFIRHRIDKYSPRAIGSILLVGCSTILGLGLIQIIRVRFEPLFFYAVLLLIAFTSIAIVFRRRKKIVLSILSLLFYDTTLACFIFMLIAPQLTLPAALFSLAIAGQVASYRIAQYFVGATTRVADFLIERPNPSHSAALYWLYMTTLISAVAIIGILVFLRGLHPIYFAVYATLPLIASVAEELRTNRQNPQNIKDFIPRNTRILLFITVIIPSVSLLFA